VSDRPRVPRTATEMQPKRDLDSGGAYASEITTVDDEAGHGGIVFIKVGANFGRQAHKP